MPKAANKTDEVTDATINPLQVVEETEVEETEQAPVAKAAKVKVADPVVKVAINTELLNEVVALSALVNWENHGTHGVDGEMYTHIHLPYKSFVALNELVKALRGEYAKSL